ncbi:hypothetical protein DC74_2982 [Streptomyces noursei]|nr:hypothetical protein DC74_2982 [Streptomyces noursei]
MGCVDPERVARLAREEPNVLTGRNDAEGAKSVVAELADGASDGSPEGGDRRQG